MQESDKQFAELVHDAERAADQNLASYKLRLGLFALLGYGVIFIALGVLVALVGGTVAASLYSTALLIILVKKKLLFLIIPACWILVKSLWVKLDSPQGYRLSAKTCPRLFEELDELRRSLRALKIHEVILTSDLNAAISQTPRLGVLGWQKNTLILGLELLLLLSPAQARAVVAHELGHLSGNHSRFAGWIYRVRQTWYRVMYAFQQQPALGARLMCRFFDWYAPRFAAYSFVLARRNEYEADAIAAELTSPHDAGAALVNTHVAGPYVDEHYWADYFRSADTSPQPAHLPWVGLSRFLATHAVARDALGETLARQLASTADLDDTHPSLNERMTQLGVPAVIPPAPETTAAQAWFGDQFQAIIDDFDADWLSANGERWRARFDYVTAGRRRIAELTEREQAALDNEELWDLARLTEELDSGAAALPLYRACEAREPDDPEVAFKLGQLLFVEDDEGFLDYMKRALARPALVVDAARYAYHYLTERERGDEAQWWRQQAERQNTIDAESHAERSALEASDRLVKADIPAALRADIVAQLEAFPALKGVWLAQKPMRHYPEVPALAMAVTTKGLFSNAQKTVSAIEAVLDLGCTYYIVPKRGDYKRLASAIIKHGERIL